MRSDLRRPGPIHIERFVGALDRQLRAEVAPAASARTRWPSWWQHLARMARARAQPLLQGGAMVVTSLAVVVAVGAAPATLEHHRPSDGPVAVPGEEMVAPGSSQPGVDQSDALPPEEFLAVEGEPVQNPDIPDIAFMAPE